MIKLTINCLDGERHRFKYKTKQTISPFRRCIDSLSQKKFDNREYDEVFEIFCGKKEVNFKVKKIEDKPFNEEVIDDKYNILVNK